MNRMNGINADDRTVREVLDKSKYIIDFFQREYRWEKKHIEQLLTDLTTKFRLNYDENHERKEVKKYDRYYLGPIVLSQKDQGVSVIDGQQRLTSLTLLLIYLNNLQRGRNEEDKVDLNNLIFSTSYSEKSFNLQVPERTECMDTLYKGANDYDTSEKGESVKNIVERYKDIGELFPDELKGKALPYFIDWLIDNVIFVKIITYSDDDAYTIFETMNDRGLNLTPSEMLKGYILSNVNDDGEKYALNELWRNEVSDLNKISADSNLDFFRAWLRAKYADTIRPGKKGAANEDFEKIGTRFHSWVRDNSKKIGLVSSKDYYDFINSKLKFFARVYGKISIASRLLGEHLESIYFIEERGLASSIYFPLLLAPIRIGDDDKTVDKKLALVSTYLEMFVVFRSINYRNYAHSSIRYTMYSLVKEIRDKDIAELASIMKQKASQLDVNLDGVKEFAMHGQNKRFVRFLLARMSTFIEEGSLVPTDFTKYLSNYIPKPFQVEHIWSDKFDEHTDEFKQRDEFEKYRNRLGALLLLPEGFNQSLGDKTYEEKLSHYYGQQSLLAKSLCPQCYVNNPNFLKFISESGLPFKSHEHFKKKDIDDRQLLYQKILETIYNPSIFDAIVSTH